MPDSPFAQKGTEDESALGGEPIALSTLLDRGIRLEWHEAVAVVRDLCQLLRETTAREPVPDVRHIWICASGRMAIAPGTLEDRTSADHPVAALGRLLLLLVDESRMPVQLRLVALSAASTTPSYASVGEFSNALAYFERPGGALPIRPVYSRWQALAGESETAATEAPPTRHSRREPSQVVRTPPQPVAPGSTQLDDALKLFLPDKDALELFLPEKPEKEEKKEEKREKGKRKEEQAPARRRRPFPVLPVAAAASVIVTAIAFVVWLVSSRPPATPPQPASQPSSEEGLSAVVPESPPVASDIDLDASALPTQEPVTVSNPRFSNSAPSGSRPGRVMTHATRPTGGSTQASAPANQRVAVAPRPRTTTPGRRALETAAPTTTRPARVGSPPLSPSPAPPRQPAADEQLPVPLGDPEDRVYSRADQDVVPPMLLRPALSLEPPPGVQPEDVSVIDVLVSDSGEVETIRLGAPARDYREAMVLSAIKTWKFRPATKDGHPVRYLKRVWIRISPLGGATR